MMLCKWEELPEFMKTEEVKPYYDSLDKKRFQLLIKRVFDIVVSGIMLILLSPLFIVLAILIKVDSKGPVFYRQERITQYGGIFRIHKFRSMVDNADQNGPLITTNNDSRITNIGNFIRKYKIDEFGQLIDVFVGDMSFVGTRPEVKKYVNKYTNEMFATLLLPAGITSTASLMHKDEAEEITKNLDVDDIYINKLLPMKMKSNLKDIKEFSVYKDVLLCFKTIIVVMS